MRAVLASLMLLSCAVARAAQAPVAFPQAYVGMVGRALKTDPFYGSQLLAALDGQLTSVAMLKTPADVKSSLESAAGSPAQLKAQLASGEVAATPSAALLVANALARPEQFREILSNLENVKPGLGKRIAEFMARTDGSGDKRLISALRLAGSMKVQPAYGIYDKNGNLEALFDGASASFASGIKETTPVPAQDYKPKPMPFPSLANMMGEGLGLKRPARLKLPPLPDQPHPGKLTRGALGALMMKMANRQNWGDVSYAASNHRTIEDKVRAQWTYEDSKADVNDYFDQLTEEQRRIADAAFAGGLAEVPGLQGVPDPVDLAWVKAHYPPRMTGRR